MHRSDAYPSTSNCRGICDLMHILPPVTAEGYDGRMTRVETRQFVMAILHDKQGLL